MKNKNDVKTLYERLTLVEGKTRKLVKHFVYTTGLLVDQAGGSISCRKSHDFGNISRRGKDSLVNKNGYLYIPISPPPQT